MNYDENLRAIARMVTDSVIEPVTLRSGDYHVHPEDGVVKIVGGTYRDATYGRISNWWTWEVVATGERKSGYGANWPAYHEGQPCGCPPGQTCVPES